MWRRIGLVGLILSLLIPGTTAWAASQPKTRGLLITPVRQYVTVEPKKSLSGKVTVANLTKASMEVKLSAERFSVIDYSYDYQFQKMTDDWMTIDMPMLELQPETSKEVTYHITAPKTAPVGGHYFTLLAQTTLATNENVRAATTLYVTVAGKLARTAAILDDTLPLVAWGGDIPFRVDVRNTGNTHFFVYSHGQLEGLSVQPERSGSARILLPQTTRNIDGVISPPLLPGLYKVSYGVKTDTGEDTRRIKLILYTPFWFWAIFGGLIWIVVFIRRRSSRHH
jgi:hypothetical protein